MKRFLCLGALTLLCSITVAAQQKAAQQPPTLQKVMDNALKNVESEFVPAADAMPEDKYGYAPTQGEFQGVPASGRRISVTGGDFSRVVDGRIAEHWAQFDLMAAHPRRLAVRSEC